MIFADFFYGLEKFVIFHRRRDDITRHDGCGNRLEQDAAGASSGRGIGMFGEVWEKRALEHAAQSRGRVQ